MVADAVANNDQYVNQAMGQCGWLEMLFDYPTTAAKISAMRLHLLWHKRLLQG